MKIYIAGPYSGNGCTPEQIKANITRADVFGRAFMRAGHFVYVPHKATAEWEQYAYLDRDAIIQLHLSILREWATAFFRIPGISPGSDLEEMIAYTLGIPILHDPSLIVKHEEDLWSLKSLMDTMS